MRNFAVLLEKTAGTPVAKVQECAERRFADQVSLSKMRKRGQSDPIPSGRYVVIGIATYSVPELALLDEIDARWPLWKDNLRIDAFSMLECESMKDFQLYLPGIDHDVNQSPIMCVWNEGRLIDDASGLSNCRNLLRRYNVLNVDS